MNRMLNSLGILKRLGTSGLPLAVKTFIYNSTPYFAHQKYALIENVFKRIKKWGIPGDYFEFGLYQGKAFLSAFELKKKYNLDIHLYGFDSFEGLPEFTGKDASYGVFRPGQYACSLDHFQKTMSNWKVPEECYTLVPGFFDTSLHSDEVKRLPIKNCAVAYIDCDLYDSTVPVLDFLTTYLTTGSIIIFDDWFSFAGDPNAGQIRAAREWLEKNKHLNLLEYQRQGNRLVFLLQGWQR